MICSESVSIKTLRLESEKTEMGLNKQCVIYFNNEELTGWGDGAVVSKINRKNIQCKSVSQRRSEVERPKTETPGNSRRNKLPLRQNSVIRRYSGCENERKLNFKEIEKIYIGAFVSITPKLKNLMLSANRAKIVKMNEAVKTSKAYGNLLSSIRVQSISPHSRAQLSAMTSNRLARKRSKLQGNRIKTSGMIL